MPEHPDPPRLDFHDPRIDMAHWYPRLADLDVPTPASHRLEVERREDEPPTWDTEAARKILVDELGGEAFARSGFKSAQHHLEAGSHLQSAELGAIDCTLKELVAQHGMMHMPIGEALWLREFLDLDYCPDRRGNFVPECRAFVRDGEVACYHPRLENFDRAPDGHYQRAVEYVEAAWTGEHGDVALRTYAERVAAAFDDAWWSVDFVRDRDGQWWCTDMALDGIYERDGELRSLSAHPGDCEQDCEALVEVEDA